MNYVLHAIELALLVLIWWNTAPESVNPSEDQRTQDLLRTENWAVTQTPSIQDGVIPSHCSCGILLGSEQVNPNCKDCRARLQAKVDAVKSDQLEAFAVDRKPRHVPWSVRRKQKQDAAKTKRKQLEEFRDA